MKQKAVKEKKMSSQSVKMQDVVIPRGYFATPQQRVRVIQTLQHYIGQQLSTDQVVLLESQLFTQYHCQYNEYMRAVKRISYNVAMNPQILNEFPIELLHTVTSAVFARGTELEKQDRACADRIARQEQLLQRPHESMMTTSASSSSSTTTTTQVIYRTTTTTAAEAKKRGAIVCGKCKTSDVTVEQKQTRGADEAMTIFCSCNTCGLRWRM